MAENELIACPTCDALHQVTVPAPGQRARCHRCKRVLIAPQTGAIVHIVLLAFAVLVLLMGVLFLPFLRIQVIGQSSDSSIFDVAMAFATGWSAPLALGVAALIVLLPMLRMMLLLYALTPMMLGRPAPIGGRTAFRWSDKLRPWAMAEVFILGAAVALVKIADLADVIYGPAFWMFTTLVVINIYKDTSMDRWSIWQTFEQNPAR